jgi:hypothetical protein
VVEWCGGVVWWADASSGRLAAGFMADGMGGDGAGRVGERDRHRNAGRGGSDDACRIGRTGSSGEQVGRGSRLRGTRVVPRMVARAPEACGVVLKYKCCVHAKTRTPGFYMVLLNRCKTLHRQDSNVVKRIFESWSMVFSLRKRFEFFIVFFVG